MTHADGTSSLLIQQRQQYVDPNYDHGCMLSASEEDSDTYSDQPPVRPIRMDGIGWVGRTKRGGLWLNLEDGIQMTLSSNGEELRYVDVCYGGPRIYKVNADLPQHVKKKLPFVAKAMASLKHAASGLASLSKSEFAPIVPSVR